MKIYEIIDPESFSHRTAPLTYEQYYRLHPELGEGYFRQLRLNEGLVVNISEVRLFESVMVQEDLQEPIIVFTFILDGESTSHQFESTLQTGSGTADILFLHQGGGDVELKCGRPGGMMTILITPSKLADILGEIPDRLLSVFEQKQNSIIHQDRWYPAIYTCLQQLIHCPLKGAAKKLYLEAKVLELIALRMDRVVALSSALQPNRTFSKTDIERLHAAKSQIQSQLEHPPSLIELAHSVGLNDFKLKKGFREIFGTTVFGYLREQRLNKAIELLEVKELNITDIALEIGYQKPSNFSFAFKKQFGMNPSEYRKKRR
jgi:AraC family transcriptional activator of pyochelin receptor